MQKINTLFVRELVEGTRKYQAVPRLADGMEWILEGKGIPTEKYDGTCCLVRSGALYKRHRLKAGKPRPPGWMHWTFDESRESGHGWLPVGDGPEDEWHREAFIVLTRPAEGETLELVGPRVRGNPYGLVKHELWIHGAERVALASRWPSVEVLYEGLRSWLNRSAMEGIVWWSEDRTLPLAKIKRTDFGLRWPTE